MNYKGRSDRFMQWFEYTVQLFEELTKRYSKEERLQLFVDPGKFAFL